MPTAELTRKTALLSNLAHIRNRIEKACSAAGKDPSKVELLAVTKYAADSDVKLLLEAGTIKAAGENKVQDAKAKWANGALKQERAGIKLHFIGHLQTNKAKAAVETFDWIDSIDSLKLAKEVDRHAAGCGKVMPVMIQLKLNSAVTQSGVAVDQAGELLAAMRGLNNLAVCGYLGIAPAGANPGELAAVFAKAKALFDKDFPGENHQRGFRHYLSLGMSGDFEAAVQAGSNLPRIGGALFS